MFRAQHHISQPPAPHIQNRSAQTGTMAVIWATQTSGKCPKDLKPKTSSAKVKGKSKKGKSKVSIRSFYFLLITFAFGNLCRDCPKFS